MLAASPLSLSETHETAYGQAGGPAEKGTAGTESLPDVLIDCLRDDSSVEGSPVRKRKAELEQDEIGSLRKKSQSPSGRSQRSSSSGSAGSQRETRRSRRLTTGKQ